MKRLYALLFLLLAGTAGARTYQAISFTHDGIAVNARLTLPATPPPYRVLVLTPGSGANDKDGTLPMLGGNAQCLYPGLYGDTLRPYKGLSDALADSGYAVLTYDKMEYTNPAGLGTITFRKLWLPVVSALQYLRGRVDVDASNITLIGHSEGSTLIPYIARTEPGVKALISIAGPRRSVYDTLLAYQLLSITRTCGGDTASAKTQGDQLIAYFSAIRSGQTAGLPPFAGVPAAVWADYVRVSDSVAINYNLAARPTLFVGLGADINVPVPTELARFRQDVTTPADFYEVPGLNHYMTTGMNPAVSEALSDTIVYWLRRNTTPLAVGASATPATAGFTIAQNGTTWSIEATGQGLRSVYLYELSGRTVFGTTFPDAPKRHDVRTDGVPHGVYLLAVQGTRTTRTVRIQL